MILLLMTTIITSLAPPNTSQPLAPSVSPLRKAGCCQWISNSQPDL